MNARDKARAERTYEVLSFTSAKSHGETRWRVVEKGTGRVLDDADGWGYKTKRNAHVGWSMANRTGEKVQADNLRRRAAWEWVSSHDDLLAALDEGSLFAAREGVEFGVSDAGALLKSLELETDFKPREIFNAWKYGNPDRDMVEPGGWDTDGDSVQTEDAEMLDALSVWDWLKGRKEIMDAFCAAENAAGDLGLGEVEKILQDAGVDSPFSAPDLLGAYLRGTPRRREK